MKKKLLKNTLSKIHFQEIYFQKTLSTNILSKLHFQKYSFKTLSGQILMHDWVGTELRIQSSEGKKSCNKIHNKCWLWKAKSKSTYKTEFMGIFVTSSSLNNIFTMFGAQQFFWTRYRMKGLLWISFGWTVWLLTGDRTFSSRLDV